MNRSKNKPYWASVPSQEIADEILDKVDSYYKYLSISGKMDLYLKSWSYYYRSMVTGAGLRTEGDQGELTALNVNHYQNLLLHLETMTTQARAAFEPRATNTDVKSQSQVILAAGLLDYYMREKHMERNLNQSVKDGLIYAEGFIRAEWDATAGEIYGTSETGATIYNGDIKYSNYSPVNVVRDFTKTASNLDTWFVLRDFENKYDLAGKYPELEDDILDDADTASEFVTRSIFNSHDMSESDNVSVYTLIHKPTPAMPNGRYTQVLQNGTVLLDGPIPYEDTHVYRLAPNELSGTCFGYSVAFDLIPVQEMLDILYSTVATNQSATGVGNILMPIGCNVQVQQIKGGLNIIPYDPKIGKPESLNLTNTPREVLDFIMMLEKVAETISGVNSVTRGNPEASLKSGSALALVQSMAIQFSMNLQRSYAGMIEDLGTGTIKILKQYALTPRVAAITGKSNKSLMRSFTADDLSEVNRVMVDMGNPLTRTTAGKVQLAETLMTNNLIKNADQFIMVLNTGRLEPAIEGPQAEMLLIREENENLVNGINQIAIITDDHIEHIMEHKIVLASFAARKDPEILNATLAHIQDHINFAKTADPILLQILGQPSFAPPPMMPGDVSQGMNNVPAPVEAAGNIQQANMPSAPEGTDPLSAEIIEGF